MTVKIRCLVCEGIGKVPGNFGGGCSSFDKPCPACGGTGMQEISEDCFRKKCYPWRYVPYIPCTQPYNPWYQQSWSISSSDTTGGGLSGLNLSQTNTYSAVPSVTNCTTRINDGAHITYT